jgi:hypothetical protein
LTVPVWASAAAAGMAATAAASKIFFISILPEL